MASLQSAFLLRQQHHRRMWSGRRGAVMVTTIVSDTHRLPTRPGRMRNTSTGMQEKCVVRESHDLPTTATAAVHDTQRMIATTEETRRRRRVRMTFSHDMRRCSDSATHITPTSICANVARERLLLRSMSTIDRTRRHKSVIVSRHQRRIVVAFCRHPINIQCRRYRRLGHQCLSCLLK